MRTRKDSCYRRVHLRVLCCVRQQSVIQKMCQTFNSSICWEGVTSQLPSWDGECLDLVLLTTCSLVSEVLSMLRPWPPSLKSQWLYQVSSITNVIR